MAYDYLINTDHVVTPNAYMGLLDESVNLLREAKPSSTVSGGRSGLDYEVDDWASLTLTSGLVYCFESHVANTGRSHIKHGGNTYGIKVYVNGSKKDLLRGELPEKWLAKALFDGTDFVLLNPAFVAGRIKRSWLQPFQVGSGLSITTPLEPRVAAMSNRDIAFFDVTNDSLRCYRFDGTNWAQVGSGLTIASGSVGAMTALSATDIALHAGSPAPSLKRYTFNGSAWSVVGTGPQLGRGGVGMAALNSTDVAWADGSSTQLTMFRWGGSSWSEIGTPLTLGAHMCALAALNETDIAFIDQVNGSLRCYRFNFITETWSLVGSGLSVSVASPSITALNATDVVILDESSDQFRVYRFDGSAWMEVGVRLSISGVTSPAITALCGTDMAFIDSSLDQLRIYRFPFYVGSAPHMLS